MPQAALDEQTQIGWNKLLLGMGSSYWQTLQYYIDTNNPRSPSRSASDWMNRAIYQLLKFFMRCWKFRNITINGVTVKEKQKQKLERIRQKITSIYADPPKLAAQFRPISEVSLAQRLRLSLPAAEHWVALIEHQVRVTTHNLKVLLKHHYPIPELIRKMETEHKRQNAWKRQSPSRDTPRKAHSRQVQNEVKEMRFRLYRSIEMSTPPASLPIPTPNHSADAKELGSTRLDTTHHDGNTIKF